LAELVSEQDEMDRFAQAIGELVLWTSIIDGQLSTATALLFLKDDSFMAETLVGEIEFRRKAELLKTRAKLICEPVWRDAICRWVRAAEEVNTTRNTVAHQRPISRPDGLRLQSHQLTRLLKDDGSKGTADVAQVRAWIEAARSCQAEGEIVIGNLRDFSAIWQKQTEQGQGR
jgi:hypothetical protein